MNKYGNMKVSRGTARKNRRHDMKAFNAIRAKKLAQLGEQSTVTINTIHSRPGAKSLNEHLHDVATVTCIGGLGVVRTYASTTDYPANIPCPSRQFKFRYPTQMLGHALETADRINNRAQR